MDEINRFKISRLKKNTKVKVKKPSNGADKADEMIQSKIVNYENEDL